MCRVATRRPGLQVAVRELHDHQPPVIPQRINDKALTARLCVLPDFLSALFRCTVSGEFVHHIVRDKVHSLLNIVLIGRPPADGIGDLVNEVLTGAPGFRYLGLLPGVLRDEFGGVVQSLSLSWYIEQTTSCGRSMSSSDRPPRSAPVFSASRVFSSYSGMTR